MQNLNTTCNYHSTDAVSEVEFGEQVFTVRRQDDICLDACGIPYGNIPPASRLCLKFCNTASDYLYDLAVITLTITLSHYTIAPSSVTKQCPKTTDICSHFSDSINQSSLWEFWNVWERRTHIVALHWHFIIHWPCGAFHHLLIHSIYYHHYHCWEDVAQMNLQLQCQQALPPALIYLDKVVKSYSFTGRLRKNTAFSRAKQYQRADDMKSWKNI